MRPLGLTLFTALACALAAPAAPSGEDASHPILIYYFTSSVSHMPGGTADSQPIAPLDIAIADLGDWIHLEWQEDAPQAVHREPLRLAVVSRTESGVSASGRRGNRILFLWFSDEHIVLDRLDGETGRLQRFSGPAGRAP